MEARRGSRGWVAAMVGSCGRRSRSSELRRGGSRRPASGGGHSSKGAALGRRAACGLQQSRRRRSGEGLLASASQGGTSRSRPVRRDSGGFAGCWRREGPSGGAAAGAGLADRCGATKREVLQEQQQQQRRRRLRGFWAEAATQARGRRRGSGGRRDGGRRRGGARRPAAQSWRSGSFWFFSPSAVSLFLLSFLCIIYKFC